MDRPRIENARRGLGWRLALACLLAPQFVQGAEHQPHADIAAAVKSFVISQSGVDEQLRPNVKKLDARLRLKRCDTPLQTFWPPGSQKVGGTTVGVACEGSTRWKIFVQVTINQFREVVVVNRPIQKGELIGTADLTLERKELSRAAGQYLQQLDAVVGQRAKTSLKPGTMVTLRMLELPHLVARGDRVVILANAAGIEVRMTGEALADGILGANIKVRNLSSSRVVQGEVVDKGVVKVAF